MITIRYITYLRPICNISKFKAALQVAGTSRPIHLKLISTSVLNNCTWRRSFYSTTADKGNQFKMANSDQVPEGILLGIGNPLLDITISADQSFLDKYGLQSNDAIIATEKHTALFEEMVADFKPIYLAGGATQNSIRVAQWLLQKPKATSFIGGVGNDQFHEILLKTVEEVDLGAAEHFTANFLSQPDIWQLVEKAQIFYIGGFIVPVSSKAVIHAAKHAAENNKIVVMNLHAKFLCEKFADPDLNLMQYVDVLFGNGDEAKAFGSCSGFNTSDIKEIALKAQALPKLNEKRKRMIVFTQGKEPTILAQDGQITEFPIVPVKKDLIKDTNGCGDAFVGGFLSQLAKNKPLDVCMECGFYASKVVQVLIGKDKGRHGLVNFIIKERNWCYVEGLNCEYKLEEEFEGQPLLKKTEKPLLVTSEVRLVDPADNEPTDIEWKYTEDGKKVRVSVRSGRILPLPAAADDYYDDFTQISSYKDGDKDTNKEELQRVTFEPSLKSFEEDIFNQMGIKEDRKPGKTYWY
ncbi:ADK [Mytilus edulis]|uniref:Adenosine kinase n=1 Tax=Mytilus edulis TaxID=6550 RepID=A0A8S3TLZ7_MYTED|nr:ADK [Mytilus edulis]